MAGLWVLDLLNQTGLKIMRLETPLLPEEENLKLPQGLIWPLFAYFP